MNVINDLRVESQGQDEGQGQGQGQGHVCNHSEKFCPESYQPWNSRHCGVSNKILNIYFYSINSMYLLGENSPSIIRKSPAEH